MREIYEAREVRVQSFRPMLISRQKWRLFFVFKVGMAGGLCVQMKKNTSFREVFFVGVGYESSKSIFDSWVFPFISISALGEISLPMTSFLMTSLAIS